MFPAEDQVHVWQVIHDEPVAHQTCMPLHLLTVHLRLGAAAQLGTSDALESKFKALEGDDVDAELAAMRRGMLGGARARPSLPEGRPIR